MCRFSWVAVKELKFNYHDIGIRYIMGFRILVLEIKFLDSIPV